MNIKAELESYPKSPPLEGFRGRERFNKSVLSSAGSISLNSLVRLGLAVGLLFLSYKFIPTPSPKHEIAEPVVAAQQVEEVDSYSEFINTHPLLINLTAKEKSLVKDLVKKQIEHYQTVGEKSLNNRINNSIRWQAMIKAEADKLGFKPNSFVRRIMPAIIFVESEGDPEAESDVAYGLGQLKPQAAEQTAKENSLKWPADQASQKILLYDPKTNINLSLLYLHHLYERFPDPSLTIWTYHLGELNMGNAIAAYAKQVAKRPIAEVMTKFNDPLNWATVHYIQSERLNLMNMLTSPAVTAELKMRNAFNDDTQHYVTRVLAAEYLIRTKP